MKFEYEVTDLKVPANTASNDLRVYLNKMGQDSWEVVYFAPGLSDYSTKTFHIVFKKAVNA
jgi:hypothetical protein